LGYGWKIDYGKILKVKKLWKRKCDAGNAWTCHEMKYINGKGWSEKFTEQTSDSIW